ncbi:DUF1572 family protein [Dyadobacter chenhuakuii]|uniref:DUF1572 domain-containing protein n=1 Tax=Dyadobacter chenhuakuii TaxID=2909339 RepID=A0A9X1QD43_9BACT|nr:DUF1572 family protein [Dyadobacter chenhuakuii]MCF2495132.1 DUF1572 domain-containing protein [Dyadobacter chenhuakuii]MCF2498212.1 DUF1572 domain-containing protein [Dyadobacter chenhuakuii]USJ31557.1 DUF1572 domain-containing protein [Dyadobacter chenhuakuii]
MESTYLSSVVKQFEYYKMLGEKAMMQLPDEAIFWRYNAESNSIALIVNHIVGNMLSRFTDFLTTDGEKPWRNRDAEFEDMFANREELLTYWNKGWVCLLNALGELTEADLEKIVYIRNDGHSVVEAINRQLAHYPYHIGQIVFIAKMAAGEKWEALSIPRNKSNDYNARKFTNEKSVRHFTDDL